MNEEKRYSFRYLVPFYITLEWKDESGQSFISTGTTENVGVNGVLAHFPKNLPQVGQIVKVTVTDEPLRVAVEGVVLRLERNAAHPQVALLLTEHSKEWEESIWLRAKEIMENQKAEVYDEWSL
jgi:hypothetical protein